MATKKSRISALEAAIAEYEANLAQKESEKDVTPPSIEEDGEELSCVDMDLELEKTLAAALLSTPENEVARKSDVVETSRRSPKAKPAHRGAPTRALRSKSAQTLTDRLLRPIVATLENAASELANANKDEFTLVPINPLRAVVVLEVNPASMALLDLLARFMRKKDQYVLARLRAVLVTDNLNAAEETLREDILQYAQKAKIEVEPLSLYINPKSRQKMALYRASFSRTLARNVVKHGDDVMISALAEEVHFERFLTAWLSGLGPEGVAPFSANPTLFAKEDDTPSSLLEEVHLPRFLTPWSQTSERDILRYAKAAKLLTTAPKKKESLLRTQVMPIFESMRPGFRSAVARSISLTEEALEVLHDVAQEDLALVLGEEPSSGEKNGLKISALLKLVPARQAWCLRAWFEYLGEAVPERDKIETILAQLREIQNDAPLSVRCRDKEVRRWGDWLLLTTPAPRAGNAILRREITVTGEATISLPEWHGELQIRFAKAGEPGIALEKFLDNTLEVRARQDGEKIKLFALKPSKNLRELYQEMKVPVADRARLPLVWLGNDLIFAAGLGLEIRAVDDEVLYPQRLTFSFKPDGGLWAALSDD